jgi:NhaP-type Na+/H+ or K+/H+ antiporter
VADAQLDAWRLTVLTILVLLLRRIPIVLATYKWIPDIKTFREAIFAGWFGPMGVGAIFISTLARLAIPDGEAEKDTAQVDNLKETIIPIVSFLVLSSVASRKLLSWGRG